MLLTLLLVDFSIASGALAAALAVLPQNKTKPLVTSEALQTLIQQDVLANHAKTLESFAFKSPARNRLTGSPGHNDTVNYLVEQLTSRGLEDYYDVTLQEWTANLQTFGSSSLSLDGTNQAHVLAQYSPNATVTGPVGVVKNFGCEAGDYPANLTGKIALVSRGECRSLQKAALAAQAGAVAAIVYNSVPGPIAAMTLGADSSPIGKPVAAVGVPREVGLAVIEKISAGATVTAAVDVRTVIERKRTFNVIAQTKLGDPNQIVFAGAHSDSVEAGPGINDNGSGSVGILEVAKQLVGFRVNNAVRFAWWSGEEQAVLGSSFYVDNLPKSELQKVKLFLNFDMIASPNFEYGIYDGDGSAFNSSGPAGSADIKHTFQKFFESHKLNWSSSAFTGGSDYAPFMAAGIPSGGLFTGAEELKTVEGVLKFGGVAGKAFDENYHQAGDTFANMNLTALLVNTKAIAHSIAVYANSLDGLRTNVTAAQLKRHDAGHSILRGSADALAKVLNQV